MLTIDNSIVADPDESADSVDKYLPEPQSLKAVLKLDDYIISVCLHAIQMEIKNLIDQDTFILGQTPSKTNLIIPLKLVLKAVQTASSGKLDKLKARVVACAYQEVKSCLSTTNPSTTPRRCSTQTDKHHSGWSSCASSRGVKLFLFTTCGSQRILKCGDFIGA
jgi:hypothetical protein